jgi:uncharacterized membrane protein YbhN (UPF0104 family)
MTDVAREGVRKRRLRSAAVVGQWVLTLGTVAAIGWIIWSRRSDFEHLLSLSMTTFWLMSASAVLTFIVNGVELQVLVRKFGTRIRFAETMRLGLMVSTLNYLPMKTGTMLLGVVMKARHKVQLTDFAALITGSSVVHLWVACTLAGTFRMVDGRFDSFTWVLLGVPTAVLVGFVVWGRLRREGGDRAHLPRLVRAGMRAIDGLGVIFSDPVLLGKEIVINGSLVGLASLRTMWAFQALSTPVAWDKAVVITAIAIFAARLSVIPGGLGFREGGAAAGAVAMGLSSTLGLGTAMIDRAVNLVWLVLLGVPATLYVQRATGLHVQMSLEGGAVTGEGAAEAAGPAEELAEEIVGPGEAR